MSRKKKPAPVPVKRSNFGSFRLIRLVLILGLLAYLIYSAQQKQQPEARRELPPKINVEVEERKERSEDDERERPSTNAEVHSPESAQLKTLIPDVQVRDEEGNVVFTGDVNLSKTIERIKREEELSWHENDGETFGNRERKLPKQSAGYYREWVHPTPDLRGPGPQRIVTGKSGEYYYTPDHYKTFVPLHERKSQE